jgi:hypothetical protein
MRIIIYIHSDRVDEPKLQCKPLMLTPKPLLTIESGSRNLITVVNLLSSSHTLLVTALYCNTSLTTRVEGEEYCRLVVSDESKRLLLACLGLCFCWNLESFLFVS